MKNFFILSTKYEENLTSSDLIISFKLAFSQLGTNQLIIVTASYIKFTIKVISPE